MTLNNSNLFMTLAALFMLITSVFFVHFIYKVIGGVKFGRDFFYSLISCSLARDGRLTGPLLQ